MVTLLLLALPSCADLPAPETAPSSLSPPPPVVTLSASPLVWTLPAELVVVAPGAGAGRRVYIGWESDPLGTDTCPPAFGGSCFQLTAGRLAGSALTDASGTARVAWAPPPTDRPVLTLQAAVLAPGRPALLSTRVAMTLHRDDSDQDGDGLGAVDERVLGTDPALVDSDGGGTSDAQERWLDGTDPLDPLDDLPGERLCDLRSADDDGDGLLDEVDPDCLPMRAVLEADCGDGLDDDLNGLVDCADPSCAMKAACPEAGCDDGVDDDADGRVDCDDEDCWGPICHDEALSWVEGGRIRFRTSGSAVVAWDRSIGLTGGTWVNGPHGMHLCRWGMDDAQTGFVVRAAEPACRMARGLVPELTDLTLDPTAGLRLADDTLWAGPALALGPDWWTINLAAPLQPIGHCAGGASPIKAWRDRDGDGWGQEGPDMFGMLQEAVWVCDPSMPGIAYRAGDCHDADPTWNPGDVELAPGATCATISWFDQDGDRILSSRDLDDRDGRP